MLIVIFSIICIVLLLVLIAFVREWLFLRNRIEFLQQEKSKYDMLSTLIQQTASKGGWIDIVHNGQVYPFGVLLDKLESATDKIQ